MDELQTCLQSLRRRFRERLDDAAYGPGARLVDLSVVGTTVMKALDDLERALRELAVTEAPARSTGHNPGAE